jgi:LRR receptor-like serine/threonine-protein kinase FLS2
MRIITSCSNLHFRALVFNFMCNGILEKHLYPTKYDNNDVCELGMKTRLDISIDVSHVMEYLHHDSSMQVVHCDIKPSNVLLDENMFVHVTNFGIAKLIGATSCDSLTSTVSLKGLMGYIAPGIDL